MLFYLFPRKRCLTPFPDDDTNLEAGGLSFTQLRNFIHAKKEKEVIADWMERKISTTFIKIEDDLQYCNFNFNWVNNTDN